MDRLTELRGRRQSLAQEAHTLRNRDSRSAEEDQRYSEVLDEIARVDEEIEREERFLQSEARDAEFLRRHGAPPSARPASDDGRRAAPELTVSRYFRSIAPGAAGVRERGDQPVYRNQAWLRYFRTGQVTDADLAGDDGFVLRPEVVRADEQRAFETGSGPEGGYLVRPELFVARLIQAIDDMTFIRQLATVIPVTDAASLGVPTLDTDAEDADWTVELGTGNEEDSLRFGKRSLTPHPLAKRIKLSRTLLRQAALDAEGIVISRLAYKFGISQEKAFLTGSGAQQPLGLFTASADGIPTTRDVSTGNTTTSIGFDGLIEAKYAVKAQYWPRARWLFHRDAVKQIAKLKDGDGQYLWQPSVQAGQPDMLLGHPLMVSEYVPNTFTTGQYVGLFGDFAQYWIADSLAMTMQRLVELYAETNQVGFIGRLETDGMPVLAEAFARVKLA